MDFRFYDLRVTIFELENQIMGDRQNKSFNPLQISKPIMIATTENIKIAPNPATIFNNKATDSTLSS